jgi:hypothetical protein
MQRGTGERKVSMSRRFRPLLASLWLVAFCGVPVAGAHHSFAVYDFETQVTFEGVVDTLSFRNPHITMTLTRVLPNGEKETINFVEGAPANMVARDGLLPDMIKPGTAVTVVGSPRKDDPDAYFLRRLRLADGKEWRWP